MPEPATQTAPVMGQRRRGESGKPGRNGLQSCEKADPRGGFLSAATAQMFPNAIYLIH